MYGCWGGVFACPSDCYALIVRVGVTGVRWFLVALKRDLAATDGEVGVKA